MWPVPRLDRGGETGLASLPDIDTSVNSSESDSCTNDGSTSESESSSDDDSGVEDYPLPDPQWGRVSRAVQFHSESEYESFVRALQSLVQQQLVDHPYNTVGSFVKFYDAFKMQSRHASLADFFKVYSPQITAEHHTCVGLSLDLIDRIRHSEEVRSRCPVAGPEIFLASCEEEYDESIGEYASLSPPDRRVAFKEHVVVALRIDLAGRPGVVLLDPGYHVARPVTCMSDGQHPHTGWFVQIRSTKCSKEYGYQLVGGGKYVLWQVRESRHSDDGSAPVVRILDPSLVYVHRRFLNCVALVERRNLVYGFRVWVARNGHGEPTAGLYFALKSDGNVTLFYRNAESGSRCERKIPFRYFPSACAGAVDEEVERAVRACQEQMGVPAVDLRQLLAKIANILMDEHFLRGVLEINSIIEA